VRFPEFVAGEVTIQNLTIHTKEWYQSKEIGIHLEEGLQKSIYPKGGDSQKGKKYAYDLLLMATGGKCFVPPIKGTEKKGVFTFER